MSNLEVLDALNRLTDRIHRLEARQTTYQKLQERVSQLESGPSILAGTVWVPAGKSNGVVVTSSDKPRGKRTWTHIVRFPESHGYTSPPKIQLGSATIDANTFDFLRLFLSAQEITKDGFTLQVTTRYKSCFYQLEINWTAIPT